MSFLKALDLLRQLLIFRDLLKVPLISFGQIEGDFIVFLSHFCEPLPPLLSLFVLLVK